MLFICSVNRYFSLILIFAVSLLAKAQDPSFTQLFNNRTLLNPSFAGLEPGFRIGLSHQNHWKAVAKRNFYTSAVNMDYQSCRFPNMGLGLIAVQDVAGDGRLAVNNLGLAYSYKILLGRSTLSMSLQSDYYNASIDWSKLVYSDQFDPVLGLVRPSSNFNPAIENANYFDFSTGLLFRNNWRMRNRDVYWHIGAAVHHLPFGFTNGFFGNGTLPTKVTLHGAWLVPFFKTGQRLNYHIMPYFRFQGQDFAAGSHRSMDLGVSILNKYLIGGINLRHNPNNIYIKNTDAIAFSLGYTGGLTPTTAFRFTYSYDFNYKGVSNGTVGTHEVSLILQMRNICKSTYSQIHKKDCFDYDKKGIESQF